MKAAATKAALKFDERVGKRKVLVPISFVCSSVLGTVVGTEDARCCHTLPAPFLLCRCGQDAAQTLCLKGSLKSTPRSVTVTNFSDCFTEKKQTTKKKAESKKAEQKVFSYI